jgi:hypothetical protein
MGCDCDKQKSGQTSGRQSDSVEGKATSRPFDRTGTAWLLGEAVRYLNTADKEGESGYARTVDVLRNCGTDVLETVNGIFKQVKAGDTSLRWNLLYVLGDAGDRSTADFFIRTALRKLPEVVEQQGCQSDRDMEMLVSTMAVHAVQKLAVRYPETSEALLHIISKRPERAILIEAVKVASELGLRDKVKEILREEDYWILDIRKARKEELVADPEREDGKERGFTPPKSGSLYTAPSMGCCCTRKEN